jgi:tripartite-type tricarboxylate transporter receptor subunit TctC
MNRKSMRAILFPSLAAICASSSAATFPERPVRLIAAASAGGGTDIIARLLAQKASDLWRQQVIVDNRAGGGGIIATGIATKAVPDGYTLLLQSVGIAAAPALHKNLPFDVRRDLAAITIIGSQPFVLAVHPSITARSVAELIQMAKAKPGQLRFGIGGVASASHLGSELFRINSGMDVVSVTYKGTGPAVTALLGGEVNLSIAGLSTMLPSVKAGKLRALAVTGAKRSPAASDLPTIAENGLPGYAFDVWYGLFASAQTPRAILSKINTDTNAALRDAETAKRFFAAGVDVTGGSLGDSTKYLQAEIAKWAKVVREADIKAE